MTGFCLGIPLLRAAFPCVIAAALAWTVCVSRREALRFALIEVILLTATAFSFSPTFGDTASCWFPMQRMMAEGWNPVWQSDSASVTAALDGLGAAKDHILVYPKLAPLVGALVAKGTGLSAADAFLPYSLMFVLWRVAVRFARGHGSAGPVASQVFAAALVITPKVTNVFVGYVDYTVYAAFLLVLLSGWLFRATGARSLLAETSLAWIVLMCVKANGTLFALVLAVGLVAWAKGDSRRSLMRAWAVGGLACLVLSVNPIVPLLREFVFADRPWVDLTGDFSGNVDALRMGRFARMVYAWVSPSLVPGAPRFDVFGGVAGFGPWFNVLLAASVAAIACTRCGTTGLMVLLVFVSSNVLPLKYVGYQRYCPQMWAIPVLAAFGLVSHPRPFLTRRCGLTRALRLFVLAAFAAAAVGLAVRAGAYFARERRLADARRQTLAQMRNGGWTAVRLDRDLRNSVHAYAISRLLEDAGLAVDERAETASVGFDARTRELTVTPVKANPGGCAP